MSAASKRLPGPPRADGDSAADEVTTLLCATGHFASKRFVANDKGDIKKIGYDAGWMFSVLRRPVSNLAELSALLLELERMPGAFVIRGEPVEGLQNSGVRRKTVNFRTPAIGRRWVLIDLDNITLPGLALHYDARAVIEHLVSFLPEEFHDVGYHYQLSSSAGMGDPRKASLHLWFWLTEPWSDNALKTWAKGVNKRAGYKLVDPALFNDVQVHYTAAPVFEGVTDPFSIRSGLVTKGADAVSIRAIAAPEKQQPPAVSGDFEPGPGFEGWLDRIGDHAGGDGFHDPIIRAVASYVAGHGREGTDVEALFEVVRKRVLAADRSKHDDAYVEQMSGREHIVPAIEGALIKFGDIPVTRRKSRIVEGLQPHFRSESNSDVATAQLELDAALRSVIRSIP